MLKEFKEFISKGNVMDLAVGVVIGSAFSAIVNSLVNDVIMPIIGIIIGGIDFSSLTLKVKDATINYGMFIQNVVNFLIIAFCIFIVVRTINRFNDRIKAEAEKRHPKKEEEVVPEVVPEEILLLREINKSLKQSNKKTK